MKFFKHNDLCFYLACMTILLLALGSTADAGGNGEVPARQSCNHPERNNPDSAIKISIFALTIDGSKVGTTLELPGDVGSLALTDNYEYQVSGSSDAAICVNSAVSGGRIKIRNKSQTLSIGDRLVSIYRKQRDYDSQLVLHRTSLTDITTSVFSGGSRVHSCDSVLNDPETGASFPEPIRCIWPYIFNNLEGTVVEYIMEKQSSWPLLQPPNDYLSSELCEIAADMKREEKNDSYCLYRNDSGEGKCFALIPPLSKCPSLGGGYQNWKRIDASDPLHDDWCSEQISPFRKFDEEDYEYHELTSSQGGLPACEK